MKKRLNHVVLHIVIVSFYQTFHPFRFQADAADESNRGLFQSWSRHPTTSITITDSIYEGDLMLITCHIQESNKTMDLAWRWKPSLFETKSGTAEEINDKFHPPNMDLPVKTSYREKNCVHSGLSQLSWQLLPVTRNVSGAYICYDKNNDNKVIRIYNISIHAPETRPAFVTKQTRIVFIDSTSTGTEFKTIFETVPSGSHLKFTCSNPRDIRGFDTQSISDWFTFPPNTAVYKPHEWHYYENRVTPLWKSKSKSRMKPKLISAAGVNQQWVFEVRNASYLDTGHYACGKWLRSKNQPILSHYIFVIDKTQKILPPAGRQNDDGLNTVLSIAFDSQKKAIPLGCGSTDPSVRIDLLDSQGRLLANSDLADSHSDGLWSYTLGRGFELNAVSSSLLEVEGEYVCATADGSQKRRFKIAVLRPFKAGEREEIKENEDPSSSSTHQQQCVEQKGSNPATNASWYLAQKDAFEKDVIKQVISERKTVTTSDKVNHEPTVVIEGEPLSLSCGKSRDFVNRIWQWAPGFFHDVELQVVRNDYYLNLTSDAGEAPFIEVVRDSNDTEGRTTFSRLHWFNVPRTASGRYRCLVSSVGDQLKFYELYYVRIITFSLSSVATKPNQVLNGQLTPSGEKLEIKSESMRSGSRFQLACNLTENVNTVFDLERYKWIMPPSEIYQDESVYYENQVLPLWKRAFSYPADDDSPFYRDYEKRNRWVLEVTNASYLDTGLYRCVDLFENRTLSRRYIYVLDKVQRILPTTERKLNKENDLEGIVAYHSHQHRPIPLGCGPTDPSITVDIWHNEGGAKGKKLATSRNTSNDGIWTFDPFQGFQLNSVNSWDMDGFYVCSTEDKSQERRFRIKIRSVELSAEHGQSELVEFSKLVLTCKGKTIGGAPYANLTLLWKPNQSSNSSFLKVENDARLIDNTILESWGCTQDVDQESDYSWRRITCEKTPIEATGTFECRDTKDKNAPVAIYNLTVLSKETYYRKKNNVQGSLVGSATTIAAISAGVVALVLFVLLALLFYRQRKKERLDVVSQALATHLLRGNLNQINPDSPLDDQAELLPYESQWEFPEESLFLEKQIGCGHFGRVIKARAIGIVPSASAQSETEVAVKTVKTRADLIELKSLVCELKILVHLGSHLNVVNLLGAVTKNIQKGTLMIIVEYCRNGNLKDFLITNRGSFVSQLVDNGNLQPRASERDSSSHEAVGEAGGVTNALPVQPEVERRLHKKFSHHTSEKARSPVITTSDLIEWSYEIASGMNYLAQKKVIHGDLAARNVLLAEDNVVKIADFGLARKFYQNSNYYKAGNEALPIKWMAIESIKDRVFSTKSDVWSYGITLWELFSLGQEPYAETESSQLLRCLLDGYRLEKPGHAPNAIGDMMMNCWMANPNERSSFDCYKQTLGSLLDPDLLALYEMPYDRYGYIKTGSSKAESLRLHDEANDEHIPQHGYLQIERSTNDSQASPSRSHLVSILANSSAYLFSDIDNEVTEFDKGRNNSVLGTNLNPGIEMKCLTNKAQSNSKGDGHQPDSVSMGYVDFETDNHACKDL